MSTIDWIMMVLLVVGGLNWGLVGLTNFDLVAKIFGEGAALSRIVYSLVGIAAVYTVVVMVMKSGERPSSVKMSA